MAPCGAHLKRSAPTYYSHVISGLACLLFVIIPGHAWSSLAALTVPLSFSFFNFGFTWYTRNYSTLLRPHSALKIRLGRGFRGARVNLKNSFFLASSEEEVVWGHVLPGFCLDWQLCCPIPLLSSGSGGREKGLPAVPPRWMLQVVCEGAHVTTAGVSVVPISPSPHHTSFNQKLHSKDTTGGTRGKKFRCTARGKNDLL